MSAHQPPPVAALDGFRYRRSGPVQLYLGDARKVLAAMPDDSVDCLVTSPPSWSLRDHGPDRNLPELLRWLTAVNEPLSPPERHPSE